MFLKTVNSAMNHVGFHKPGDGPALLAVLNECLAHAERSTDGLDARLDAIDICKSLQRAIDRLEKGKRINRLQMVMLFLPTGDLQETAIDNGWGNEFVELSDRFEAAI